MNNRTFENCVIACILVLAISLVAISISVGKKMFLTEKYQIKMICEMKAEHSRMQRKAIPYEKCMKMYEEMMAASQK